MNKMIHLHYVYFTKIKYKNHCTLVRSLKFQKYFHSRTDKVPGILYKAFCYSAEKGVVNSDYKVNWGKSVNLRNSSELYFLRL